MGQRTTRRPRGDRRPHALAFAGLAAIAVTVLLACSRGPPTAFKSHHAVQVGNWTAPRRLALSDIVAGVQAGGPNKGAPVDAAAYQRFYVFFVVAGGLLVGASLAKLRRDPSLAVFGGLALMTAAALRLAVASGARRPGKDEGKVAAADQWRHHGFDGGA